MKAILESGSVILPQCSRMTVEDGAVHFLNKFSGRTLLSVPTGSVTAITDDYELYKSFELLIDIVKKTKIKDLSYRESNVLKQLKSELKNFNAAKGIWK